jgi:hypothetical protein
MLPNAMKVWIKKTFKTFIFKYILLEGKVGAIITFVGNVVLIL